MGWKEEAKAIEEAIARFPYTFHLRGRGMGVYRFSPTASYVSEGKVMLYAQRQQPDGSWLDACKGEVWEFEREARY